MCYRIYKQILEKQGASDDVDSRLAAEFQRGLSLMYVISIF